MTSGLAPTSDRAPLTPGPATGGTAPATNSDPLLSGSNLLAHSGFVTLIGRANSGKSTLVNAIVGRKVAITTPLPQTTRHRLRAILDGPDSQLILVDTPGLHKPQDALGEELNISAIQALAAVDAVAFLLDASRSFGNGDRWVLQQLAPLPTPRLLVLSKIDLVDSPTLQRQQAAAEDFLQFQAVLPLSALTGVGVMDFVQTARDLLPAGPRWFPAGTTTDQDLEVLVAEFIREKILNLTSDEVPYAVGVQTEELDFDSRRNLTTIAATIYVERESQKGILIGKAGERIKTIGTLARADLERLLGHQVYLDLRVKLRKNWRRDANQVRRFGYG
ncbi:MAG: GTPase Era [Actinomycetia bacterium]|nr:GTPase Era [Actinomycetes bacterium]